MKTKTNNTNTFSGKHSHCKLCLIGNACNVCKHYKMLKDKNLENASTLLCYAANIDHYAMELYERSENEKTTYLNKFAKILWGVYGNSFGLLWRRYNESDKENLSEKEKRDMHIYIYDVLDKYNMVAYFEEKLGINLTKQYNDYFVDATIEEYKKYAK